MPFALDPLDLLGTVLGLAYLYLEIKENAWMWVVGSVMPMIYIVVLYRAGIYADCAMEVYYFFAGLYGLACWLRGRRSASSAPLHIQPAPRPLLWRLALLAVVLWGGLYAFLALLTDSRVPLVDALTTALSVIGLWMLSRKYLEQWLVWLVVDGCSVGLYLYKGLYGRSLLYAVYTAMAIYGFVAWRRRMVRA